MTTIWGPDHIWPLLWLHLMSLVVVPCMTSCPISLSAMARHGARRGQRQEVLRLKSLTTKLTRQNEGLLDRVRCPRDGPGMAEGWPSLRQLGPHLRHSIWNRSMVLEMSSLAWSKKCGQFGPGKPKSWIISESSRGSTSFPVTWFHKTVNYSLWVSKCLGPWRLCFGINGVSSNAHCSHPYPVPMVIFVLSYQLKVHIIFIWLTINAIKR